MTARQTVSHSQFGAQFEPIRKGDLSTSDARRSPEVSHEEFQARAAAGAAKYAGMSQRSAPPKALDEKFDRIVSRTHRAVQQPWGGATIDTHTGRSVPKNANAYALTVRPPGTKPISIPAGSGKEDFVGAMHQARSQYGDVLAREGHHLGVFHDADKGTIDIDPVVVVKHQRDAEDIGAATRATGGAYHFKSGDGYWPPHVRD